MAPAKSSLGIPPALDTRRKLRHGAGGGKCLPRGGQCRAHGSSCRQERRDAKGPNPKWEQGESTGRATCRLRAWWGALTGFGFSISQKDPELSQRLGSSGSLPLPRGDGRAWRLPPCGRARVSDSPQSCGDAQPSSPRSRGPARTSGRIRLDKPKAVQDPGPRAAAKLPSPSPLPCRQVRLRCCEKPACPAHLPP